MRVEKRNEVVAPDLLELTARVVASFVSNHRVRVPDLPALINSTYQALASLDPRANRETDADD
jgi:predicted transcriptional regulator